MMPVHPVRAVGRKFGSRKVVAELRPRTLRIGGKRHVYRVVRVLCRCGTRKDLKLKNLIAQSPQTCGCIKTGDKFRALISKRRTTHGESMRGGTPEYNCWRSMKKRCYSARCHAYANYGGRGIQVCSRWRRSFQTFIADMGRRPSRHHSIDRKNNNGNYTPSNCRWATATDQRRNRRDSARAGA